MNGVAHLRHFGEHHRRAGTNQEIGGKAHGRVGRHARERIRTTALDAHDEIRGRAGLATTPVEGGQPLIRTIDDGIDHRLEADETLVLQSDDAALGLDDRQAR